MAAEVRSFFRIMNAYADDGEGKRRDLVTRDLLGDSAAPRSAKELDLDLRIPSGWERRLDLKSGEMYLKKSEPDLIIHDLNFPPPNPESTSAVDLKLLLFSSAPPPSDYQCTLEKVKSALERAGRESRSKNHNQQRSGGSPSLSSSSTTSSSSAAKRRMIDQEVEEVMDGSDSSGSNNLIAAGCSKCLMYVLISKGNPRCPRCDSHVPLPAIVKKPRIDLNSANLL